MPRRRAIAVLAVLAAGVLSAALAPSCLPIDGGAIELSWVAYCADGRKPGATGASCSCNRRAADLGQVQLVLTGVSDGAATDGCAGRTGCSFAAGDQSGNTGFYVPPGDYDIALLPLTAAGEVLGGPSCVPDGSPGSCWQTPAPIRRTVTTGQVVSLGSLLIAVPDCPSATGCATVASCPATTP